MDYENKDRVFVVYILEQLYTNKELYDVSLSFTQNMYNYLDTRDTFIFTEHEKENALNRYITLDKQGQFGTLLKEAIDYFDCNIAKKN